MARRKPSGSAGAGEAASGESFAESHEKAARKAKYRGESLWHQPMKMKAAKTRRHRRKWRRLKLSYEKLMAALNQWLSG